MDRSWFSCVLLGVDRNTKDNSSVRVFLGSLDLVVT